MSSIEINGKKINTDSSNILIQYGKVIVDGNVIQDSTCKDFKVVINGNYGNITCAGDVEVNGTTKDVRCDGDVYIKENVNYGDIDCNGSVYVDGDVTGDIQCDGDCNCRDVIGRVDTGGSVNTNRISDSDKKSLFERMYKILMDVRHSRIPGEHYYYAPDCDRLYAIFCDINDAGLLNEYLKWKQKEHG